MTTRALTRGGLKLDTHKRRSTTRPLRAATIPELLVLPVDQHAGSPAAPVVKPGDRILRGQPIAEPGPGVSAWLHSPVSGTVRAVEPRPSALHRDPSLCIVIENDGANRVFDGHPQPRDDSPQALREHIARGGIVGLGGAIFPTGVKLLRAAERNAHLIVNGAECEPWISCDDLIRAFAHQHVVAADPRFAFRAVHDEMRIALRCAQKFRSRRKNCSAESNDAATRDVFAECLWRVVSRLRLALKDPIRTVVLDHNANRRIAMQCGRPRLDGSHDSGNRRVKPCTHTVAGFGNRLAA
jgi:hypothetical protein